MFPFLLESVCFDSIKRLDVGFIKVFNKNCSVMEINGQKFENDTLGLKVLAFFSSKTRKITEINVVDYAYPRFDMTPVLETLIKILENGVKNNWMLEILHFSVRSILPQLRQFVVFAKDTVKDVRLHAHFCLPFTDIHLEEVSKCYKLQVLDLGHAKFSIEHLSPLLQSSELSLVVLRISLFPNALSEVTAILKRFRRTLKELSIDLPQSLALKRLLERFEENDEPIGKLEYFNCLWIDRIKLATPYVKKLFQLFPKLNRIGTVKLFEEEYLYEFARQFLQLFRYHTNICSHTVVTSFYCGIAQTDLSKRLLEAFPPEKYKWEIIFYITTNEMDKIVIQQGNAKITLLCHCW